MDLELKQKRATGAKRKKTTNQFKARENQQPVQSAGKFPISAKRRKTCNQYKARENQQGVPTYVPHSSSDWIS